MAYRVVFHLTESAASKVEGVLSNIRNLLAELEAEVLQVELVTHADGLAALYRSANPQAGAVRQLAGRGVRFAACRNTMKSRGLQDSDLLEVAQVVPSGIAEVVRRQEEGWLYVRP